MNTEAVLVSVLCNTYNHEKFIAQTLEGFVMQKTTFPFEVLVHDDASTDGTTSIIREFEAKYPEIIKPIYQEQNQYSQKIPILWTYQYPRARGKYIALCEGDDYWTDPYKLQKQVTAMEAHPEVDICAHQTAVTQNEKIKSFVPKQKEDTVFSAEQVILGGGAFVATNSLMYRHDLLGGAHDYTRFFSLDYIIQISGSLRGGMLYLSDCMSVYRQMTNGSWTAKTKNNVQKRSAHASRLAEVLRKIDDGTNHKYASAIEAVIGLSSLKLLALRGDWKVVLSQEYRKPLLQQPLLIRCKILLLAAYKSITHAR